METVKKKKIAKKQTQNTHVVIWKKGETLRKEVKSFGSLAILIKHFKEEKGIDLSYFTVNTEIKTKARFFKATEDYQIEIYKTEIIKGNGNKKD